MINELLIHVYMYDRKSLCPLNIIINRYKNNNYLEKVEYETTHKLENYIFKN